MLTTQVSKGITGRTVLVTADTEQELDDFIKKYLQEYAPEGYGTSVRAKVQKENSWTVTIHRWNSCD